MACEMHTGTLTSITTPRPALPLLQRVCMGLFLLIWHANLLAQTASFAGQWQGVWHIGMSSGKVTMRLDQDAQGVIAFTNLPGFGNEEFSLQKTTTDKQSLLIAVQNEQSNTLSARLQLNDTGNTLQGMGQYAGASVKFEFHSLNTGDR